MSEDGLIILEDFGTPLIDEKEFKELEDFGVKVSPGGTRLEEAQLEEFIRPQNKEISKEILKDQMERKQLDTQKLIEGTPFVDTFSKAVEPTLAGTLDPELFKARKQQIETENQRIEDLLKERFPNYAGTGVEGPLTFSQVDGLMRRTKGPMRQAYFKKIFPEGNLFNVKSGNDIIELYETSPGGKKYRVSNEVLSLGDLGKATGSFAKAGTAGAILGTIFLTPLIGTAAGYYIGDYIDDLIAGAGLDQEEFKGKLFDGERATWGLVEGAITKFAPGLINAMKRTASKITGLGDRGESWWLTLGFTRPQGNAWKAAEGVEELRKEYGIDLPLLNIAQISDSILVRGMGTQISATSRRLPENLSKQKAKLYDLMVKKAGDGGDFSSFSSNEIANFLDLSYRGMKDDLFNSYSDLFLKEGTDFIGGTASLAKSADALVKRSELANKALTKYIDDTYNKAFDASDAQKITFDISSLQSISAGLKTPAMSKKADGTFMKIADIDNRLLEVLDKINDLSPQVKAVSVGAKETQSAFGQIKALRDQVAELAYDDTLKIINRNKAVKMLDAFDDFIINGVKNGQVTGGKNFLKFYQQAGELYSQRKAVSDIAGLSKLFKSKTYTPQTFARGVLNGDFNKEQYELFMNVIAKHGTGKRANKLKTDMTTTFRELAINDIVSDPVGSIEKITNLKERGLLETFFPNPQFRQQLDNFILSAEQLNSSPFKLALNAKTSQGARALQVVQDQFKTNTNDLAIQDFIQAGGGVDGKAGKELRAALFKTILAKSKGVDEEAIGGDVIDPKRLSTELDQLKLALSDTPSGDYVGLRALFGTIQPNGKLIANEKYIKDVTNIKLYADFMGIKGDVGGKLQAGVVRSGLINIIDVEGALSAYQTLFTNNLMSRILASTPSVQQLKQYANTKGARKIQVATTIIQEVIKGLDNMKPNNDATFDLQEDISQTQVEQPQADDTEVVTTQQPPINQVSQATLPFDRRTTVPPPAQQTGQGITNFASLFANDPIGEAIANRRLTQGIGSIG